MTKIVVLSILNLHALNGYRWKNDFKLSLQGSVIMWNRFIWLGLGCGGLSVEHGN